MTTPVRMPMCPGCGKPPLFVMGGGTQAFCGTTTGCRVMTWDPTADPDQLWSEVNQIDLYFMEDGQASP